jgi:hypothetical protein
MRKLTTTVLTSVAAAAVAVAAAGCYTTDTSRRQAKELTAQLTVYRDQQQERVTRINQEYHDAFAKLMDALEDLSAAELQQGRDGDAQHIADGLIADGGASLRSRFRGAFAEAVRAQRERIHQADLAVATVHDGYVKSYSDAQLEMSKIKSILGNMRSLSEENADEMKEAVRFIQLFVDAYEKARQVAASQPTTKPT